MKQPDNKAGYLYIWGREDAMSLLVRSKPNLTKQLTIQHPDVFLEYCFLN